MQIRTHERRLLRSRYRTLLLASLLLTSSLLPSLHAADWKAVPKPTGYVSDFSEVLDQPSRASLEAYATEVERLTGAQLAFVTLRTLQGDPIEDVANDLFHAWGIGQKGKDNGVLLLLVTQDHRSRLEIGHGLEEFLPDGFDGLLLQNMRPELRAGNYGPAMLTAAQAIGEVIAKSQNVTLAPPAAVPNARPRVIQRNHEIPWLPILLGVIIFWALLRGNSRGGGGGGGFWTGLFLGNLLNSVTYGGRGGGGFGGFDSGNSGGGFGGFGGGDSGGGGASSDW